MQIRRVIHSGSLGAYLMTQYLANPSPHYDLVTPDGVISAISISSPLAAEGTVVIQNISPAFVGFEIDPSLIFFNIKSTLAQIGIDGIGIHYELDKVNYSARIQVQFRAIGDLAAKMIPLLTPGTFVGKLFAADDRRRVRNPDYLARYFGRSDRKGRPLLSLGGLHGSTDLILDKVDGRTIAYLSLQHGRLIYDQAVYGFLPVLQKALAAELDTRNMVRLYQEWVPYMPRNIVENEILLLRTLPLHIRTVFGRVVDDLLVGGYKHTTASVLQPNTHASGDIYELYGNSQREITDIPLEFYTLDPYREHVFFSDRDQLQARLEDPQILFHAFDTAPKPETLRAAIFVVKSEQMLHLRPEEWVACETRFQEFPGPSQGSRQALMVERFIKQQPAYPFLKAIDENEITSQGVLLTRHFLSPLLKRMLLSDHVQRCLKGIYFQYPSDSFDDFFSTEDRSLLHDLEKFAIPVYWVDKRTEKILQYVQKPGRDSGLFVPLHQVETFLKSTIFGIYGSHLVAEDFQQELKLLLEGILKMRSEVKHPLLNAATPLALVTGGGPGVMEAGNLLAQQLGILSCANIVDFSQKNGAISGEQQQNPYIEAKMTYRLDKLVERQAEFNLDFPIFLTGGVGTDFEFSLEEVRRKVGGAPAYPVLLFGERSYWQQKITPRFQCNRTHGTIRGYEWLSNCFFCVQTAQQGLHIYRQFFDGVLPIGRTGPVYDEGFVNVADQLK